MSESYSIIQGILWWLFNICAIFWKVKFPFHDDKTNKTKYIHMLCVISGLLLPITAPVTISLKGGFTFSRFPPVVCVGRDVDANFYTFTEEDDDDDDEYENCEIACERILAWQTGGR